MCGIAGFNWGDKSLIRRMASLLSYRGPDQEGFHIDRKVSLGHKRLSIIDLSEKGRQPLYNESNDICIVFNGEIYNFREIRKDLEKKGHRFYSNTDTEVIIHAYESYGESCLNLFNGCFAFAIYDSKKQRLFLARDRLGIKPLYYYIKDSKFIFASEIKAILEDDEVKREINQDSLNNFIMLRYIPGKETIFRNIFRILAGHYAIYDLRKNSLETKKYWDVNLNKNSIINKNEEFFAEEIRRLLEDSVKKRLVSDVPLGAYLSGGIDSSAIVAIMSKLTSSPVKTFSVGFENDPMNELSYAKSVSELFNTEHKEFIIKPDIVKILPEIAWHLDEPMSDPAAIPNYLLSEHAKKKVSVVLTGDGGDDIFMGYDQFKFSVIANKIKFIPPKIMSLGLRLTPEFILNKMYKYSSATGKKIFERFDKFISSIDNKSKSYLEIVSVFDEEERKELFNNNTLNKINDFNHYEELNKKYFSNNSGLANQILYMELKRYLPEDLLMKPDKMCSAHSVEARAPFLDHRLVEFSFQIPESLKLRGFTTKYILKKALHPILPKEIIYRKKQPFQVPLDKWISADLKPLLQDFLSEKNIKKQGYFDYPAIEKIFRNYENSKLFYGRQLWNLLMFTIWHKIFIEREKFKI